MLDARGVDPILGRHHQIPAIWSRKLELLRHLYRATGVGDRALSTIDAPSVIHRHLPRVSRFLNRDRTRGTRLRCRTRVTPAREIEAWRSAKKFGHARGPAWILDRNQTGLCRFPQDFKHQRSVPE